MKTELTRENVVKQFWTSFVEDKFDVDDAIQTKAEFSYAIAVMDKIGGWEGKGKSTRELGGSSEHVDLRRSCKVQRAKTLESSN